MHDQPFAKMIPHRRRNPIQDVRMNLESRHGIDIPSKKAVGRQMLHSKRHVQFLVPLDFRVPNRPQLN